jgi:hypothetical protein
MCNVVSHFFSAVVLCLAPELKKSLFHVYGQFGKVMDVQAKKTLQTRGQAFVVFEDVAAATRAVRDMQGFNFYGKQMVRPAAAATVNSLVLVSPRVSALWCFCVEYFLRMTFKCMCLTFNSAWPMPRSNQILSHNATAHLWPVPNAKWTPRVSRKVSIARQYYREHHHHASSTVGALN